MSTSIVSSIPGRLRVRHPSLRSRDTAERSRQTLSATPGVQSAEVNLLTGSALVRYDPALVDEPALLGRLALPEPAEDAAPEKLAAPGAALPRWMGASLALSVGAAALKVKWLHVAAGAAFVALVGVHVAGARRRPVSSP